MDKSILKKFAIESREMLMTAVENKLNKYYVDEELEKTQSGDLIILKNNRITLQPLTFEEFNKRTTLISRIKDLSEDGSFENGKNRVIEETAYTWFNRIVAIRYMELNDMLPLTKDNQSLGIRVLSSINNESHPEILKIGNLTNTGLDLKIDFDKYNKLINENEQFNYVLNLICNKLGTIIPQVFDGITDYIDLLLPENLLSDNGFVNKVIKEVPEGNFKEGVEIIGWLYQYYNQIEKDRAMSSKGVYKKSEIPYVTQLFTPDWIVKYMVENSLGRYWVEHNGDKDLINNWKYFIKDNIEEQKDKAKVTEIKFIDPCCGSGHILVYAFEVLYQIYREQGYNKNDIPELILKNNLFGLDIDDRAGQLSILSVILKAREYDKDIFNKNIIKDLNVYSIQETNNINKSDLTIIKTDNELSEIIDYIYDVFQNAKEIGSLLILENKDYDRAINEIKNINDRQLSIFDIEKRKIINEKVLPILKTAKVLSNKYECVVTNPPYLNNSSMSQELKNYLSKYYEKSKSDLCTAFMEVNLLNERGYFGIINQHVWMFINSFMKLREHIIDNYHIVNMIHLGTRAFEEIGGEVVQTTSFVFNKQPSDIKSSIYRLVDFDNAKLKETQYLNMMDDYSNDFYYSINLKKLKVIPGSPFAYWSSDTLLDVFQKNDFVENHAPLRQGLITGDNNRFLRMWYEIDKKKINVKWFHHNKGGEFRRWYGNRDYVINWENDGYEIKNFKNASGKLVSRPQNIEYNFRDAISWSMISTANFAARYYDSSFTFNVAGLSCFPTEEERLYILGLFNTKIVNIITKMLNPTINLNIGDIAKIPVIFSNIDTIKKIVEENIKISKEDWDSFETSWDFFKHPLIEYKAGSGYEKDIDKWNYRIKDAYESWKSNCDAKFNLLKQNEEKLNRLFIDIYGLQDELTPEVEEKDITIRKADKEREIKSLISYAVGCMFGRYSLDEDGLIYAGGNFDKNKYKTYEVDLDNIIPVTEEKYFKDDIVERFVHFIEIVYGKETLKENLDYIADTIGRKNNEDSEDTIRRYFVNDFYKDHIKIYQKKPIYWMFESGKKNGFKCLIYLHRYDENLVAKIRLDYLDKIQRIYEARLQEIKTDLEDSNLSNYDVKKLEKEQESLQIKLEEIKKYNDKLSTIGNKKIKIDLDDGVTENYKKFLYVEPITNKESSILAEEKTIIPKKK